MYRAIRTAKNLRRGRWILTSIGRLWSRLFFLASLITLLAAALSALIGIDGWVLYYTAAEIFHEIAARVVIAVVVALFIATVSTVLTAPYALGRYKSSANRIDQTTRLAVFVTAWICGSAIIGATIRWGIAVHLIALTNRGSIYLWDSLALLLGIFISILYLRARSTFRSTSERTFALSGSLTRRWFLTLAAGGFLSGLSRGSTDATAPVERSTRRRSDARPNIILITFDALSAQDVSSFGYRLPTTPHIDALAKSSHLFVNYYAASTFTTPCVTSILTGRYPSNTHVYHYGGRLHGIDSVRTLPNYLRAHGYATGASVANPGAHPGCLGFGNHFLILPPPPIKDLPVRKAVELFSSAQLADDIGRAERFVPYMLEQLAPHAFGDFHSKFPPSWSFAQANQILGSLTPPFFLWIHVFAPHFPYLPEAPYLHRFLPSDEFRTHAEVSDLVDLPGYDYSPAKQPLIDKVRLRYDEWIAQADGAFGQFLEALQRSSFFDDTAILVSADHGESFQGGFLGHGGGRQLRSIVQIPLLIHLPGQTSSSAISTVFDQTTVSPTILEIAKLTPPDWMDGESLGPAMRAESSSRNSLAFTQFLAANSVFKPIDQGTCGVIDGRYQYVFDLATRSGALYLLTEANTQKSDLISVDPAAAARLHRETSERFADIAALRHA